MILCSFSKSGVGGKARFKSGGLRVLDEDVLKSLQVFVSFDAEVPICFIQVFIILPAEKHIANLLLAKEFELGFLAKDGCLVDAKGIFGLDPGSSEAGDGPVGNSTFPLSGISLYSLSPVSSTSCRMMIGDLCKSSIEAEGCVTLPISSMRDAVRRFRMLIRTRRVDIRIASIPSPRPNPTPRARFLLLGGAEVGEVVTFVTD